MRIGPADVEFYYSAFVLRIARSLDPEYDQLQYGPRQRVLDKAVGIATDVLNDDECRRQMHLFAKQHWPPPR